MSYRKIKEIKNLTPAELDIIDVLLLDSLWSRDGLSIFDEEGKPVGKIDSFRQINRRVDLLVDLGEDKVHHFMLYTKEADLKNIEVVVNIDEAVT